MLVTTSINDGRGMVTQEGKHINLPAQRVAAGEQWMGREVGCLLRLGGVNVGVGSDL